MKHKTAALVVLIVAALTLSATATAKPHGKKAKKVADKVTICHQPGTPAQDTMSVPTQAVNGHLGHGDTLGACAPLPPPPPPPVDEDMVPLCHKPGTPAQQAMDVPESAVGGHLGHGDYLGACDEDDDGDDGIFVVAPPAAKPAGTSAPVLPKGIQRAVYCDTAGKALNLIFGQPLTDPAYKDKGIVLAVWLKGVGAVCDAKGATFTGQYTSGILYGGKLEMLPAWTYTAGAGGLIYLAYPLVSA